MCSSSLDADLQDDIEAIPRMLAEYRQGAEIVFGVRHKRATDTFFKMFDRAQLLQSCSVHSEGRGHLAWSMCILPPDGAKRQWKR